MAIRYEIEKHTYAFPTKVLSERVGRTLNIVIDADTDNGVVCGKGDYVSFDQYKKAVAPSAFKGKVLEQAADGNWYVEVTAVDVNDPAVLIYEVPEVAETYNAKFTAASNFFNEASATRTKTVRGFVLTTTDIYEISAEGFSGTPEAGKSVTIDSNGKHVIGD